MPVVQEDADHPGLIWVRCPQCKETKPLELGAEGEARLEEGAEAAAVRGLTGAVGASALSAAGPAEPASARRVVRYYRQGERFSPGDWIYHEEWDDTGRVVDKRRSRGGREVIEVSFERMGTKRLVSNFAR